MSTLKKNLGYQTLYQLLNTCLPLVTSPYLARVLGAAQQGVFSYTQSIVNYFTLFAMLGIVNYGTRTIAACGENREKRTVSFWNIYAIQFVASFAAMGIYGSYLFLICGENILIAWIQGLYILGSLLDINWLFFGVEEFDVTVKRSMIIRIASVVGILVLVKSPEDLWIYTIIMAGSTVLSNGILWWFVPKLVDLDGIRRIKFLNVRTHIKPVLILFVPLIAMSVYHIMDKTMLGILSSYEQTGFYYNADKIINIPIGIITGIGTVMLPRMSALEELGKKSESEKLFEMSVEMVIMLSSAMAFGISAVAKEFTPLFFGNGFDACILLMIVLSPVLIIKSISQTIRMQYLIPTHRENIFIQAVFAGAIVNFIVNSALINKYGALGAVIGTLTAELVTCVWQCWKIKKDINIARLLSKSICYLVFGFGMMVSVRLVANVFSNRIMGILLEICTGGLVYLTLCSMYWVITKNPILQSLRKSNIEGV